MNRIPLISLGALILLNTSCTTVEERAELVRTSENVLFECRAMQGGVLLSGEHIAWEMDGTAPLLVTPTTLYCGRLSVPLSQINSVEVRDFDHAGEIFVGPRTFEDLVIIQAPLANFLYGFAIRIMPEPGEDPESVAGRAEGLQLVLEAARRELDPFGRVRQPRPVWAGFCDGDVRAMWGVEPRYLRSRHPGQAERVMEVFRQAGTSARDVQAGSLKQLLGETAGAGGQSYEFNDAGMLSLRGPRLPGPVRKAFRDSQTPPDCIVLVDVPFVLLEERMDPYTNVSILARVRTSIRFIDLERQVVGSELVDSLEVSIPLESLLEEGPARIHLVMEEAARQTAGRIQSLF